MFFNKMKNAESIMAAFLNCCLVEKNNLFTETLLNKEYFWKKREAEAEKCSRIDCSFRVRFPGWTLLVAAQNLLGPFYFVFAKDTLRHFPLLGGLSKQL